MAACNRGNNSRSSCTDTQMTQMMNTQPLKKSRVNQSISAPTLRLNVSAFIPDEYVADPHQRLSCYKRLSSCTQVGDLALLHGEIQDRYGLAPDSVERLFEVMQIRLQAKALRLSSIELNSHAAVITLDANNRISSQAIHQVMDRYKKRLCFLSPLSFELRMPHEDWPSIFRELTAMLQSLKGCGTNTTTSPQ